MPVSLHHMRDEMLPGLRALEFSFVRSHEIFAANIFNAGAAVESLPAVSLPVAFAMGAAAVVVKNPVVTRRFWEFWKA